MDRSRTYWKSVLVLTMILCLAAALAWYVVPGVRAGTVPAVGGLVWHLLAMIQVLLSRTLDPMAARVGAATAPVVGTILLPLSMLGGALLASLLLCLPLRWRRQG